MGVDAGVEHGVAGALLQLAGTLGGFGLVLRMQRATERGGQKERTGQRLAGRGRDGLLLEHEQVVAELPADVLPECLSADVAPDDHNAALRDAAFCQRVEGAGGQRFADAELAV